MASLCIQCQTVPENADTSLICQLQNRSSLFFLSVFICHPLSTIRTCLSHWGVCAPYSSPFKALNMMTAMGDLCWSNVGSHVVFSSIYYENDATNRLIAQSRLFGILDYLSRDKDISIVVLMFHGENYHDIPGNEPWFHRSLYLTDYICVDFQFAFVHFKNRIKVVFILSAGHSGSTY